jgi:hypothetical protein
VSGYRYELREVRSPLTPEMLAAPTTGRGRVQFNSLPSEPDLRHLADWLAQNPGMALRAYGSYDGSIRNLEFLRLFPKLRRFYVDYVYDLESLDGMRHLPADTQGLAIGSTKRPLDLSSLARFSQLLELSLEGQTKGIHVVGTLTNLQDLTLRSITLPDLQLLQPLKNLTLLDIKLGGTRDLSLLPEIGNIRYLELWMIRGLSDISAVGRMESLHTLFLQALKRVETLPDFSRAGGLRRVHLETMRGLTDLSPLESARGLEEIVILDMGHLDTTDIEPLSAISTLKRATVRLGTIRKNAAVEALLGLPPVDHHFWRDQLAED